jgi:flagella basal body P-ring formation protein FlgA
MMKAGILLSLLLAVAPSLAAADPVETERLPVPAVTIYPGDTITENMVTDRDFPLGTAARYPVAVATAEVAGKVARRTLLPGRLIALSSVAVPERIARGKVVRAVLERDGLVISASVLALQSGPVGAVIEARNIDSGKILVGVVEPDGTLRVGGP